MNVLASHHYIRYVMLRVVALRPGERKLTSASRSLYTLAVIIIKFKNTKNDIPNSWPIWLFPTYLLPAKERRRQVCVETDGQTYRRTDVQVN